MDRFAQAPDPLTERISDAELREILDRLGDVEFGGDERATVGAIVEATGADAATILRLLGEIRQQTLDDQREEIDEMERRVSHLESRTLHAVEPRVEAKASSTRILVALFVVLSGLVILGYAGSSSHPDPGATHSMSVADGELRLGPDMQLRVVRPDGTSRQPTKQEESAASLLYWAAATSQGR